MMGFRTAGRGDCEHEDQAGTLLLCCIRGMKDVCLRMANLTLQSGIRREYLGIGGRV